MTFKGQKEMSDKIKKIARDYPLKVKAVLVLKAELKMTVIKDDYVPVRDGILRGTGMVTPIPGRVAVMMSFGGSAALYAEDQHENTTYHHTHGGPFYLKRGIEEMAATLLSDIAREARLE